MAKKFKVTQDVLKKLQESLNDTIKGDRRDGKKKRKKGKSFDKGIKRDQQKTAV